MCEDVGLQHVYVPSGGYGKRGIRPKVKWKKAQGLMYKAQEPKAQGSRLRSQDSRLKDPKIKPHTPF
ncbi:Hypothetical predicted protein [Prunus dulcis]|uniref:Uncharacterized protein n=1 Tax=Prunus dulcis TaxID=3755 RepID=A0A5E4G5X3_PRUDU|nr:hypothetical protein L3X38_036570 [Prunus dulcis]VVA35116.1 Hypothetical predicted protein [Prunus dulcis]